MTFNPNFPTASTPIPQFQQILTNWSQLNTTFGTDHAPFTETVANNIGHHKFVTFYQVSTDPSQNFPFSKIYTKNVGASPNQFPSLYFSTKGETAPDRVFQLVDGSLTPSSGSGVSGGLQIRSGQTNTNPVSFVSAFPTAAVSVVICASSMGSQVNVTAFNPSGFTWAANPPAPGAFIFYIATGY